MKKIVVLSIIASFALADNTVVNDLTINQNNEIKENSNFSNGAIVSQGQTDIKNGSTVNQLGIRHADGADFEANTNTITATTISGIDSQVHQALTSIDNSRVENTELDLSNTINDVTITNGTSTVTQGNLIIGGESNVTGISTSTTGGGTGFPSGGNTGGATGEKINITQTNTLDTTNIEKSIIHQGLTTINGEADVSNSFILTQSNRIEANSKIESDSEINQGTTNITGGTTSNIQQNIQNVIKDSQLDGTKLNQSTINLTDSTVSNINNDDSVEDIDDKNRVDSLTDIGQSTINQSTININASIVNNIERADRPNGSNPERQNNWIYDVTTNKSTINQSRFIANSGSNVENMTYLFNDTEDSAAVNNLYSSHVENNSTVNQDVTELTNATITGTNTISRQNIIQELTITDNATVSQNSLKVTNSTVSNLNISEYNLVGGYQSPVTINNANLSQGEVSITD